MKFRFVPGRNAAAGGFRMPPDGPSAVKVGPTGPSLVQEGATPVDSRRLFVSVPFLRVPVSLFLAHIFFGRNVEGLIFILQTSPSLRSLPTLLSHGFKSLPSR